MRAPQPSPPQAPAVACPRVRSGRYPAGQRRGRSYGTRRAGNADHARWQAQSSRWNYSYQRRNRRPSRYPWRRALPQYDPHRGDPLATGAQGLPESDAHCARPQASPELARNYRSSPHQPTPGATAPPKSPPYPGKSPPDRLVPPRSSAAPPAHVAPARTGRREPAPHRWRAPACPEPAVPPKAPGSPRATAAPGSPHPGSARNSRSSAGESSRQTSARYRRRAARRR